MLRWNPLGFLAAESVCRKYKAKSHLQSHHYFHIITFPITMFFTSPICWNDYILSSVFDLETTSPSAQCLSWKRLHHRISVCLGNDYTRSSVFVCAICVEQASVLRHEVRDPLHDGVGHASLLADQLILLFVIPAAKKKLSQKKGKSS